jgi:hypothetical protein
MKEGEMIIIRDCIFWWLTNPRLDAFRIPALPKWGEYAYSIAQMNWQAHPYRVNMILVEFKAFRCAIYGKLVLRFEINKQNADAPIALYSLFHDKVQHNRAVLAGAEAYANFIEIIKCNFDPPLRSFKNVYS